MDDKDTHLDNELADLTDAVLSGKDMASPAGTAASYEKIVRELNSMNNTLPSPAFRAKLTSRLNEEWDTLQRQKQPSTRWYARRSMQVLALAAALVVLVGLATLISVPKDSNQGFTSGNGDVLIVVGVMAVAAVVVGVVANLRNRK